MMSSIQEEENLFDRLPEVLVFTIFNKLHDAKSLCISMSVCKRFHSIIPQVDFISLAIPHPIKSKKSHDQKSSFKNLVSKVLIKPLRFILQAIKPRSSSPCCDGGDDLLYYSLTQVLKPFKGIQRLDVVLPSHGNGNIEIGPRSGNSSRNNRKILLKWKAEFGRQLQSCVILGATSFHKMDNSATPFNGRREEGEEEEDDQHDHGEDELLPFTDDDLKLRIVWTITCLIAASARHYLLSEMLVKHQMVKQVSVSDQSMQGRLCMNDDQVKELRGSCNSMSNKPGLSSLLEMRTRVPALRMKMWYAPEMELPDSGWMMKGATLMVVRPAEVEGDSYEVKSDGELVVEAFDGEEDHVRVINEAMAKLMKSRRNYTLEINSF